MTNGFQLQLSNSYGASHCYYGKILKVTDFDFKLDPFYSYSNEPIAPIRQLFKPTLVLMLNEDRISQKLQRTKRLLFLLYLFNLVNLYTTIKLITKSLKISIYLNFSIPRF